ncbi:MAG TPA: biotin/lipoyl-containing protein, partial [Xanthobacteraceae bacterium]|nr:biotin/lipoyl-containing protein [Xanthobacteraceae bacterium]
IESRVYAEDPTRNFLPSTGRLTTYRPPEEKYENGITVRNDTGVYEGGEISIWYDPMIAKLVTHAKTREAAIDAQAEALDAFAIDGIRHNIPFLTALMAHPRWRAGKLSTGFIAEEYPDGFHNPPPAGEGARMLAAVAVAIDHKLGQRKRRISGQLTGRAVTRATSRRVWLDAKEYIVEVTEAGATRFGDGEVGLVPENGDSALTVRYRGEAGENADDVITLTSRWRPGEAVWSGTVNGSSVAVQARPVPNGYVLSWRGAFANAQVYTEREANYARLMPAKTMTDSGKKLLCPMPGLVKAIAVAEGQEVKAGETLAIVEAMKMENVLRAERDGTVKKLHAKAGDSLAVDAVIMEFA